MKPQDVLQHPTNVLTAAQRQQFFDEGYLVLPRSGSSGSEIDRATFAPSFMLRTLTRPRAEFTRILPST